jgi:hypothetical protein
MTSSCSSSFPCCVPWMPALPGLSLELGHCQKRGLGAYFPLFKQSTAQIPYCRPGQISVETNAVHLQKGNAICKNEVSALQYFYTVLGSGCQGSPRRSESQSPC